MARFCRAVHSLFIYALLFSSFTFAEHTLRGIHRVHRNVHLRGVNTTSSLTPSSALPPPRPNHGSVAALPLTSPAPRALASSVSSISSSTSSTSPTPTDVSDLTTITQRRIPIIISSITGAANISTWWVLARCVLAILVSQYTKKALDSGLKWAVARCQLCIRLRLASS